MTERTTQDPKNAIRERLEAFFEQETISLKMIFSEEFHPSRHMTQCYIRLSNELLEREIVLCCKQKYETALDLLYELLEGVYYVSTSVSEDDFLDALDLVSDIESHHEFYALCKLQSAQLEYLLGTQCFLNNFLAIYRSVSLDQRDR